MYKTVNHGENATFNCTVEGGPGTLFQWLYNGAERLCSSNCSAVSPSATTDIDGTENVHTIKIKHDLNTLFFAWLQLS